MGNNDLPEPKMWECSALINIDQYGAIHKVPMLEQSARLANGLLACERAKVGMYQRDQARLLKALNDASSRMVRAERKLRDMREMNQQANPDLLDVRQFCLDTWVDLTIEKRKTLVLATSEVVLSRVWSTRSE